MKTKDFENFKTNLDFNIEIDSSLRRITEKIKVIAQFGRTDLFISLVDILGYANDNLDIVINENLCESDDK